MLTSNFTAEIDSRQTHNTYIADSDAYRMMRAALQNQRRSRQSQCQEARQGQRQEARQSQCQEARQGQRQMAVEGGYRLIERFGARLIAIGRALCERRGALAVEIAFHAGQGDPAHKPGGRHVA